MNRRMLTLRAALCTAALLISAATVADAANSFCGQGSDLAAARLRWAAARQSRVASAHGETQCQVYGISFYEAATVRQAVATCRDGVDRQRDLALIDSEIEAFNNLIATQCGS